MQLLIFRHGLAEDHSHDGHDKSRRLTEEGVVKTTHAAQGLARIIDPPDVILTSPKVRAAQTAEIIGKVFKRTPEELEVLAGSSTARILASLADRTEANLMIVGHEPTLSHLAMELCTRSAHASFIELKKAGCICLEVEIDGTGVFGHAQLVWLATPKMLRAMGGRE